ncbi:MAG: hypothetical protein HZA03_04475 [Nitrospinae bacterium]|nr:hypothetical protein [Nitrospinota bacterium]
MNAALNNARGITLIAVIFLLVFLGGLGIAVSRLAQNQALTADSALAAQEAFYGAYAGAEWGLRQRIEAPLNTPFATLAADFTAGAAMPGGVSFTTAYTRANDTLTAASTVRGCTRSLQVTGFCCSVTNLYGYGWCCPVTCGTSSPQNLFALAGGGNGILANQPITFAPPQVANAAGAGLVLAGGQTYSGVGNTLPPVGTAPAYINITGDLTLGANAQMTINGPAGGSTLTVYVGGNMTLGDAAAITVNGNVQFVITGSLTMLPNSGLLLNPNAELLVQTGGGVTLGNNAALNSGPGNGGGAANALIMSVGNVQMGSGVLFQGGIYAMGNVAVGQNNIITGAIAAGGAITVGANATVAPGPATATQSLAAISPC